MPVLSQRTAWGGVGRKEGRWGRGPWQGGGEHQGSKASADWDAERSESELEDERVLTYGTMPGPNSWLGRSRTLPYR
jgi:hypothetical protein